MGADNGGQHLPDRGPVGGRITGDPLQRIESTQPHIQALTAELVDRSGEPLGDLPFPAGLQLPVGDVRAHQQRRPAKALQEGRADLVLGPQPLERLVRHKPWRCHHEDGAQSSPSTPTTAAAAGSQRHTAEPHPFMSRLFHLREAHSQLTKAQAAVPR
jgi:hypothetical protein